MSSPDRRSALGALEGSRITIARLDPSRHPEDNAADIIDGWNAVETALRSMIGGTAMSGQPLLHEARQRQLISFAEANALAAFHAARDRVQRTDYRPTSTDIQAAKTGFHALEKGLAAPAGQTIRTPATAVPAAEEPLAGEVPPPGRPARRWVLALTAAVLVIVIATVGYLLLAPGSDDALEEGIRLYQTGQLDAARARFTAAIQEDSSLALAYVYLGRIAREQRDYVTARERLDRAIRLDPQSALAMREMASLMFATQSYELARQFYVRALERDPTDRLAQGYLGCSLIRLGRVPEGLRFIQRAGQGPWTACVPPMPPPAPA